jgi:hypothetical protein
LIFHAGGPVPHESLTHWIEVTGTDEMTNKVMCDTIRTALEEI